MGPAAEVAEPGFMGKWFPGSEREHEKATLVEYCYWMTPLLGSSQAPVAEIAESLAPRVKGDNYLAASFLCCHRVLCFCMGYVCEGPLAQEDRGCSGDISLALPPPF